MNNVIEFPKSDKYMLSVIISELKERQKHLESFFIDQKNLNDDSFESGWRNAFWDEADWMNGLIEELEKNL